MNKLNGELYWRLEPRTWNLETPKSVVYRTFAVSRL